MSLIVDVLKTAQMDGVAKRPLPQFIKYQYEEGSRIKAFISRNARFFGIAIGFSVFLIVAAFGISFQRGEYTPNVDVSHKIIMPTQRSSASHPEANFSEGNSTIVSKEKTQPIEPEKKMPIASSKGKKVRSEKQYIPKVIIALEKPPSHGIKDRFGLAVSYQKLGEITKAVEEYGKVIEIEPMNVEAHNNLGVIYKDMGRLNQAVREFRTVLSMAPRHEKARNNLGVIFYLQGNMEKAIQEFRGILELNPGNKEAYINLGVIYQRQNRTGKAKRMLENALSIDPHCSEAQYNLGLISEENGDIKEAISHYRKFIDLSDSTYSELTAKVKRHLATLLISQKR